MKPDQRTISTSRQYQCATEFAEEIVQPPAAKKRALEPVQSHAPPQPQPQPQPLPQEEVFQLGDASRVLRLPSIKHLQLDMGVSWPMVEQFFSSPSRQSPQPTAASSSTTTPTTLPTSLPPSPVMSPVASPAFPSSPALVSPSSTPTLLRDMPMVTQPLRAASTRVSPSTTPLSLSATSIKTIYPSSSSSHAPTSLSSSAPSSISSMMSAPSSMSSMMSSYQITTPQPPPPPPQEIVPVVTNNFGFIETTFSNGPMKKTHRRRPANVDKTSLYCHNCGAKNTPEWRRGPSGPATLCNACGLAYAKRIRQEEDAQLSSTNTTTMDATVNAQSSAPQQTAAPPQQLTFSYNTWYPRPQPQQQQQPATPTTITTTTTNINNNSTSSNNTQQAPARPMQLVKGMPVRINSHTFHNYTPPTPHPSSVQHHQSGYPITNQVYY